MFGPLFGGFGTTPAQNQRAGVLRMAMLAGLILALTMVTREEPAERAAHAMPDQPPEEVVVRAPGPPPAQAVPGARLVLPAARIDGAPEDCLQQWWMLQPSVTGEGVLEVGEERVLVGFEQVPERIQACFAAARVEGASWAFEVGG